MSAGSYELVIDWCGRPLVANKAAKMHWGAVGRERTAWGDAAIQAARIAKLPPLDRVTIELTALYPMARSLPDSDGLAPTLKGIVDGLVRARYLVDDSSEYVAWTRCHAPQVDRTLNRPTVVVTISPAVNGSGT